MSGNRCPSCNKFVSPELDDAPEVEVQSLDLGEDNKTAILVLNVRMTKVCPDCGEELSTKDEDVMVDVDITGFEPV